MPCFLQVWISKITYIDEETMRIHHDKHHAAYVNMLNGAVEAAGIGGKSVKELITDLDSVPEA